MRIRSKPHLVLVSFPSTAVFGQQSALAFLENGALDTFLTTFYYDQAGLFGKVAHRLPERYRARVESQLRRRAITALPLEKVTSRPFWEIARTLAQQGGASAPWVDRIWDRLSHEFTKSTARRLNKDHSAIYAYEYTALEAFEAAREKGIQRILDFPSLNSREFEKTLRQEQSRFPELISPHDLYFRGKFERRQARRDAEMQLADLIITNSSVTRASHIAGGAPADRTFAVPYGAPPPIGEIRARDTTSTLRVVWAGTFNIRKGAHYFLEAWRLLAPGANARADVYGAVVVPDRLWRPAPDGITFHGSVVRQVLFNAFEAADILIFPTLSDGFGMVVTEAFARGLPVITTDRAGASDLVRHGQNGLIVTAGNSRALVEALEWCLDNRSALAAMRQNALDTAKSWQWSDYRKALFSVVTAAAP